jgi:hypothetical protein
MQPAIPAQGCYAQADINCMSDAACGGRSCLKRSVDPCANPPGGDICKACSETILICL